jgi:hypothetical protein
MKVTPTILNFSFIICNMKGLCQMLPKIQTSGAELKVTHQDLEDLFQDW